MKHSHSFLEYYLKCAGEEREEVGGGGGGG